jgi:Fe-S cluster assembly iron-binding protein IscA
MIRFTERAREVLEAAERAARRFDPGARVRLRRSDDGNVVFDLTNEPGPDDEVVDGDGFEVVVQRGLDGVVDAGEHNVLTLQPDA